MKVRRSKTPVYLTIQQRRDILQKLEEGAPRYLLVKKYNINDSTLRRIELNAARIRQQSERPEIQGLKRLQTPILIGLDTRLYSWFLERQEINEPISDLLLQEKATAINTELGGPSSFSASKGWIWSFKRRHGIRLLQLRGESVCASTIEEFTRSFIRRLKEENIDLENVYNMDETGLMWRAIPQEALIHFEEKRFPKNMKSERVTVGLCANATGTHKLPPLFIHKYERSKALKHCRGRLSIIFKAQQSASMDRKVFVDWFENHFKPAVKRQQQLNKNSCGKILLLLDICKAHVLPQEKQKLDENIDLVFFPINVTSILQPMGQGIIEKMKRSFRHRMLRKVLEYPGGVKEFYKSYDIKDCINILDAAWMDVTQIDVCQSWNKVLAKEPTMEQDAQTDQEMNPSNESSINAITETVSKIAAEMVPQQAIEKWLTCCNEEEGNSDLEDLDQPDIEEVSLKQRPPLNQMEIKKMFKALDSWSQTQPTFIKIQVQALQDSYEYTQT